MVWGKSVLVWLLMVLVETVHGVLRQLFLVPLIGDLPARQLGVLTGSALIILIALLTARWLALRTLSQQLLVGTLWLLLMLAFEIGLGLALGYPVEHLLADYRPSQGGYMALGLFCLWLSPVLAATVVNRQHRHAR